MRYRMLLAVTHSPKAQVSNITSRVEMIQGSTLNCVKSQQHCPLFLHFPPSLSSSTCPVPGTHQGSCGRGRGQVRPGEVWEEIGEFKCSLSEDWDAAEPKHKSNISHGTCAERGARFRHTIKILLHLSTLGGYIQSWAVHAGRKYNHLSSSWGSFFKLITG